MVNKDKWIIPNDYFDDFIIIENRCKNADSKLQGALRSALTYLYATDEKAIYSLGRERFVSIRESELLTDPERLVLSYLFTRGEGSERRNYDRPAIKAARVAKYRCVKCGFDDVRALALDHLWMQEADQFVLKGFQLLCCNCHAIKSRTEDWNGKKHGRDKQAGVAMLMATEFPNVRRKRK